MNTPIRITPDFLISSTVRKIDFVSSPCFSALLSPCFSACASVPFPVVSVACFPPQDASTAIDKTVAATIQVFFILFSLLSIVYVLYGNARGVFPCFAFLFRSAFLFFFVLFYFISLVLLRFRDTKAKFSKKVFALSVFGLSKKTSGVLSSTIFP